MAFDHSLFFHHSAEGAPHLGPVQRPEQIPSAGPASDDPEAIDEFTEDLFRRGDIALQELQQLEEASASAGPIKGLSSLIKVQTSNLRKARRRKQSAKMFSALNAMSYDSECWAHKWSLVKKCRALVGVHVELPRSPRMPVKPGSRWEVYEGGEWQEKTCLVDAIVDNGATWLKWIGISRKTLERQVMAHAWESGDEDDDMSQAGEPSPSSLSCTEFVDTINKLVCAARWNHCRDVHIILSRIRDGESELVDQALNYVRSNLGGKSVSVTVTCANTSFFSDPPPEASQAIEALTATRDPLVNEDCLHTMTPILNLDPGILISLVTDVPHGPLPHQPLVQQNMITGAFEAQSADDGSYNPRDTLTKHLYPNLHGRRLVCTKSAAAYFWRVIDAIATTSEEARAALILPRTQAGTGGEVAPTAATGQPPAQGSNPSLIGYPADQTPSRSTSRDVLEEFQKWSTVSVLTDLILPVEVVDDVEMADVKSLVSNGQLPPISLDVAGNLSKLNCSIYMYGWANRLTTLLGNRSIQRQLTLSLAKHWRAGENGLNVDQPDIVKRRYLGGYLMYAGKPPNWTRLFANVEEAGDSIVPQEMIRWTYPIETWGRGYNEHGWPDSKSWPGVGDDNYEEYGLRKVSQSRWHRLVARGKIPLECSNSTEAIVEGMGALSVTPKDYEIATAQ